MNPGFHLDLAQFFTLTLTHVDGTVDVDAAIPGATVDNVFKQALRLHVTGDRPRYRRVTLHGGNCAAPLIDLEGENLIWMYAMALPGLNPTWHPDEDDDDDDDAEYVIEATDGTTLDGGWFDTPHGAFHDVSEAKRVAEAWQRSDRPLDQTRVVVVVAQFGEA